VGIADGDADGVDVGTTVGIADGDADGVDVGTTVGIADGDADGVDVDADGVDVGTTVGIADGDADVLVILATAIIGFCYPVHTISHTVPNNGKQNKEKKRKVT
jgi:hypothetical protein